jgi:hypothetical protein
LQCQQDAIKLDAPTHSTCHRCKPTAVAGAHLHGLAGVGCKRLLLQWLRGRCAFAAGCLGPAAGCFCPALQAPAARCLPYSRQPRCIGKALAASCCPAACSLPAQHTAELHSELVATVLQQFLRLKLLPASIQRFL